MFRSNDDRRRSRRAGVWTIGIVLGLAVGVAITAASVTAQSSAPNDVNDTNSFWTEATKPEPERGKKVAVTPLRARFLTLDTARLGPVLAQAPRERTPAASHPLLVSLPAPNGTFHQFALQESAIMAPGLARRHPEIKTYNGRGITDRAATIHADLSPLGFRASVRSANGSWYVDPYYVGPDPGVYASYWARHVSNPRAENPDTVVESLGPAPEIQKDLPTNTGDQLRTYRLAMITDPGYSTYHGGPGFVTAAKVALMNRVSQVYEDDMTIRLQLVNDTDLLNFNDWDKATAPNGPCGAVPCFTQAQVTGCSSISRARYVIGQIIGASNYEIGHLALGQPGGGVANLGVVGGSNKAGGCTGLATPVGDFFAVDYVAHEMGHQFAGNHTFNGNQLNCSGGNRNAATSVEPGAGQSVMAYAGICLTDDIQPHSDGYFAQRSQQEIVSYVTSSRPPISEVQTVSLRHFGGGDEVQVVTFGTGFSRVNAIAPVSVTINAPPSATSRGGAMEVGTTATIATSAPHGVRVGDEVTVAGVGVAGYNGTWTVTAVPTTRSFQYTNTVSGLGVSGGGTVTPTIPGAGSQGTTATIRTTLDHGRSVGDVVTIAGVGVAGYNGTYSITAVPSPRTFQYTIASQLGNSGGGTVDLLLGIQGAHRRQRLRPHRRKRAGVQRREPDFRDQRHSRLRGNGDRDRRHSARLHDHLRRSLRRYGCAERRDH